MSAVPGRPSRLGGLAAVPTVVEPSEPAAPLLTLEQVAERLSVSVKVARALDLPVVDLGPRSKRYRPADVDRLVRQLLVDASPTRSRAKRPPLKSIDLAAYRLPTK